MTSDSGVTDIDQPLLTPPKSVTSPLNWFDTSMTISQQPMQQRQNVANTVNSGQNHSPRPQLTEEEKVHLLAHNYLAASQESTESAHHYKQALSNNDFDSPAINTNNSGHSGADALHGAIPYRVRSRENMIPFSPSPEGFQNNTNALRFHQRMPSAPPQRIPTQFNNSDNPTMHIRQRSADLIGDNMDQFIFPPQGHHSEPNFDMHIEPDWYLSPNSKPKYQRNSPVPPAPQNHMMDWMLQRRSESFNRLNAVQSYSGRSTPVRHLQYPHGNNGGSAGKNRTLFCGECIYITYCC